MLLNTLKRLDLPRANDLSARNLYHLITAYILLSIPMISTFPFWLILIALFTTVLKVSAIRYRWRYSKWWMIPILLLSIVMIIGNIRSLGLSTFSVAFLFMFASLKLLETREERDAFILMLVNFLLILGVLMAHDGPLVFIFVIFCFFYNIFIQLRIAQPEKLANNWKKNTQTLFKILLISLPFVIGLFFLFPRIDPLWHSPLLKKPTTGISDEMSPNSLSELTQDGGLAFRVKFTNKIPRNNQLYWRGPVLSDFDGNTWRRSANNVGVAKSISHNKNSTVSYRIYHNGETKKWVVPLDIPGTRPSGTSITTSYELMMSETSKPRAFDLFSFLDYRTQKISNKEHYQNRLLPTNIFPKTRELARSIARKSKSVEDFSNRVLSHFREQKFYYDLAAPVGNSDIDTFLFENKIGYCEHYASSFVFMMRSQGVPARIVTGYQGGELNTVSGEMEVRNYNAHAWAEIYTDEKGWLRYDPTAAIAPERINTGTPFGVARNTDLIGASARWENNSKALQFFAKRLRAMQAFWQNWIINYDSDKQNSLWQRLGLSRWKDILWIATIIVLIPITAIIVWWYRRRQTKNSGDDVSCTMRPFVKALSNKGITKPEGQPWQEFIKKNDQLGAAQPAAQKVISHYYNLRYSYPHVTNKDINILKALIQRFIKAFNEK